MGHEFVIGKYTLESLTNGMYASSLDMYREYIQNAVDSFDAVITQKIEREDKLRIDITIDKEARVASIKDNGCGISKEIAVSTLLDIGNSQKSRSDFRGFRGIGRLAGLGYCEKLTFITTAEKENVCTIIEFDAKLLKALLLPGNSESVSVNDVISKIVTIRSAPEMEKKRYFEVRLEGISSEEGLLDIKSIKDYLTQHAPLAFDPNFKWHRTVLEKMRLAGYIIPQYRLFLNGTEIFKPYQDSFLSDRVKKNEDIIQDIKIKTFSRGEDLCAILWYVQSSFYGTVLDNTIKGIRIRQGNILLGDKGSCNQFFKEERFNGWIIGELHVVDNELIANSRRDGFEKNAAYYELIDEIKEWAFGVSKDIRHISYERSLNAMKKAIVEADTVEDVNDLCIESLDLEDNYNESSIMGQSESDEIAEADYIGKLSMFLDQIKSKTKYTALNINDKLTGEQRRVLERVFDLITQEYEQDTAESFINTISKRY